MLMLARRLLICATCLAAASGFAAEAQGVSHRVRFAVEPTVIVDGDLQAVAADDSAAFSVASNSGFEICVSRAGGGPLSEDELRAAGFQLNLTGAGALADPNGAPEMRSAVEGVCVWTSTQKTARLPGSPDAQALSFEARWSPGALGDVRFTVRPR